MCVVQNKYVHIFNKIVLLLKKKKKESTCNPRDQYWIPGLQRSPGEVNSFPQSSAGKESACNSGDPGLIPGLGRSSGEGNGNPLQYSNLENPMNRGAWQAAVHGITRV